MDGWVTAKNVVQQVEGRWDGGRGKGCDGGGGAWGGGWGEMRSVYRHRLCSTREQEMKGILRSALSL